MIKILAVDDEAPICQWLQYCISNFDGFICVTASNAREGLEIFQAEQPEIVFSDIEMPGMDGLEMLRIIQQKNPGVCSVVMTSHEDFGYARTALKIGTTEYILKTEMTQSSLREVLEKLKGVIVKQADMRKLNLISREHYLQVVALHQNAESVTMDELRQQGILLDPAPVVVMDYWNGDGDKKEIQQTGVLPAIRNVFSFMLGTDHIITIANTAEPRDATVKALKVLWDDIFAGRTDVCCGISDIMETPDRLRDAIDQARYRCVLRFYEPEKHVFYSGADTDIAWDEEMFQMEYMQALLNQDFLAAYACIQSYLETVRENQVRDIAALKKVIMTATISFLHFARDISEDVDAKAKEIKGKVQRCGNINELSDIVGSEFNPFVQRDDASAGITAPVQQAITYMELHYAEKITLSEIACCVFFSPEHLSRLFSKETGVNYITYLNNLRMKHAVALLEGTTLKIYEIAEKVGYSSLSYFSTAFKRKFGQNPYEYQLNFQDRKRRQGNRP